MKKWMKIAGMLILTLPVVAQATDCPATNVTITLPAGENVPVSYAYESTNNTIATLFAKLPNGSEVDVWDNTSHSWKFYTRGLTGWGTSGTNRLTRGVGVLVKSLASTNIVFSGSIPSNALTAIDTDGVIAYPYPVDMAFINTEVSKVASRVVVFTNGGSVIYFRDPYGEWEPGAKNLILKNCNNAFSCQPEGLIVYEPNPYLSPRPVPLPMPKLWLNQYGLTNYDADEAVADPDGDGLAVWQEYVAGTDPTSPASSFCVTEDPRNVLGWNAVSGRVYSVYWTTNLLTGFQCLESNIPWTQVSFTNSTDVPCGYYKIGVRLEN